MLAATHELMYRLSDTTIAKLMPCGEYKTAAGPLTETAAKGV